jgi:hypothetical protein
MNSRQGFKTSGVDTAYHDRLKLLAELMVLSPNKPMRKLQREALKYYPVDSKELQRHLLGISYAFKAADIANKELYND